MTENNISSASDTITMYCTQPDLVWDIVDKRWRKLCKTGLYHKEISRHCLDF